MSSTFLNQLRMLLLAAWLGTAIYFSAVIAPSVFKVLRSFSLTNPNEIAGTIVTRTLSVVNTSGFVLSLLMIIITFAIRKNYARLSLILQLALLTIVALATGLGEWVIAARMRGLRVAMHGQIDQIPLSDPNRMAFAALHGYSVAALGLAMIAVFVMVVLMVLAGSKPGPLPTK
ncbi:MAG TPA: DUF4149 domain-containing protein [Pyrinomonadaceae bacterium]|jgi:uncharacterized membrane protein YbhN (UPF0104 family)